MERPVEYGFADLEGAAARVMQLRKSKARAAHLGAIRSVVHGKVQAHPQLIKQKADLLGDSMVARLGVVIAHYLRLANRRLRNARHSLARRSDVHQHNVLKGRDAGFEIGNTLLDGSVTEHSPAPAGLDHRRMAEVPAADNGGGDGGRA